MSGARPALGWREVRRIVRGRIAGRVWTPGDAIPNEADLAAELGCARTTINRALRALADEGLLDRRRRGGTRVAAAPTRRATFRIPVVAREIESRGLAAGYRLFSRAEEAPPPAVAARMGLAAPGGAARALLHVVSLHTGDGRPYMVEDRWIDPHRFAPAGAADFGAISANEWLVTHAPFDHGDIAFAAEPATAHEAACLGVAPGSPVFVVERTTYAAADAPSALTAVRQVFHPGYRLRTAI